MFASAVKPTIHPLEKLEDTIVPETNSLFFQKYVSGRYLLAFSQFSYLYM